MNKHASNGYEQAYMCKEALIEAGKDLGLLALLALGAAPIAVGGAMGGLSGMADRPAKEDLGRVQKDIKATELREFLAQLKRKRALAQQGKETGINERSLHI
jgi:hypothetical protein